MRFALHTVLAGAVFLMGVGSRLQFLHAGLDVEKGAVPLFVSVRTEKRYGPFPHSLKLYEYA